MIQISNGTLTAKISLKGAELKSLQNSRGEELMWSADPAFWGKTSPVLYPVIGTLKDDMYVFKNQEFKLPRHGFARDMEFFLIHHSESKSVFQLASNMETLEKFPFPFLLEIAYAIEGDELIVLYTVKNSGSQEMYFSIGGHPAFAAPHLPGLHFNDYRLFFPHDEFLLRNKLENGLLSHTEEAVKLDTGFLQLDHQLFEEDAIVLRGLKSEWIGVHTPEGELFRFHFSGFPHFGIWTASKAPFICLEPWQGHADFVDHDGDLRSKEGIVKLAPGGQWTRSWMVECF